MTSKLKRYYERTADIFRKIRFLFLSSKEIEKSKGTIRKMFLLMLKKKNVGEIRTLPDGVLQLNIQ